MSLTPAMPSPLLGLQALLPYWVRRSDEHAAVSSCESGTDQIDQVYTFRLTSSHHLTAGMGAIFVRPRGPVLQQQAKHEQSHKLPPRKRSLRQASVLTIGTNASAEEAEALYACSRPWVRGEPFDFVSHSWNANATAKSFAVGYVYHSIPMIIASNAAFITCSAIGLAVRLHTREPLPLFFAFWFSVGIPCALSLLLLAFMQHCACARRSVFLDRLCIHQTDPALKQAGIDTLGDAVIHSSRFLMMASDDYFSRLWCVCELAMYVSSHEVRDLRDLRVVATPMWYVPFNVSIKTSYTVLCLSHHAFRWNKAAWEAAVGLLGHRTATSAFIAISTLAIAPLLIVALRWKVRKHSETDSELARYELANSKVQVESDRAMIHDHIRELHGSTDAFERFVRTKLRAIFAEAFGSPEVLPLIWLVQSCQSLLWYSSFDALACVTDEQIARLAPGLGGLPAYFGFNLGMYAILAAVIFPTALRITGIVSYRLLRLPAAPALACSMATFMACVFVLSRLQLELVGLFTDATWPAN